MRTNIATPQTMAKLHKTMKKKIPNYHADAQAFASVIKPKPVDIGKALDSGGLTTKDSSLRSRVTKPEPKWKEPNYKGYKWGAGTGR